MLNPGEGSKVALRLLFYISCTVCPLVVYTQSRQVAYSLCAEISVVLFFQEPNTFNFKDINVVNIFYKLVSFKKVQIIR